MKALSASSMPAMPTPPRSSSCSLKPPVVPMPCTGGGGNITMKASWIAPNFWFNCCAIAAADSDAPVRSSKGLSVTKTMPEFELLVKPLIDRPGKDTA